MEIINSILPALPILFSIILLESILSIDNASVLAVIVNKNLDNPVERSKAFKYGMIGAYVFRGASLFLVSYILNYPSYGNIFMIIGGIYLVYLFYSHLTPTIEDNAETFWERFLSKYLKINVFWKTVIIVEVIDLVFSLDNLVAVVGMSKNIWIIVVGVFIGIAVMRFVAVTFSKLLAKYPQLEKSAFYVILLIGLKLIFSGSIGLTIVYKTTVPFFIKSHEILGHHSTDLIFSAVMLVIFAIPFITGWIRDAAVETIDKMEDYTIEPDGTGWIQRNESIVSLEIDGTHPGDFVIPEKIVGKPPRKKPVSKKAVITEETVVPPRRKRKHNRKKKSDVES